MFRQLALASLHCSRSKCIWTMLVRRASIFMATIALRSMLIVKLQAEARFSILWPTR